MPQVIHPDDVCWFLRQLRLSKGRWAGKPLPLRPFQERLTHDVFRLDAAGNRVVNEAIIGMARKNGKTPLVAGWGLALLLERPGGEIVAAAAKRDQAKILLKAAKDFVRRSSFHGEPLEGNVFQVRRGSIYCPETDSVFKVVSSEGAGEHGHDPHVVILEELHSWTANDRHVELLDALTTAQGARANPLLIGITTAGAEPRGIWYDYYRRGKEIERGVRNEPYFCFRWWETPDDYAIDDPEGWRLANPGLGTIKYEDYMRRQLDSLLPEREYTYRRLHLNQPTRASERWLPYGAWYDCGLLEPDIPDDAEVYIGLDAATRRDTFGVSVVWLDGQDPPHAHVRVRAFTPDNPDGYIDPRVPMDYVLGLASRYRVREVRYDPSYMRLEAAMLADRGVPMEPVPQTSKNMTRATETLQRFVLDRRLRHGMDRTLDTQMAAVGVRETDKGVRISKSRSGGKIDTAVALALALDAAVGDVTAPDEAIFEVV